MGMAEGRIMTTDNKLTRAKASFCMSDAAELERQAALARMADQEWIEEDGAMRMLGIAIIVCMVVLTVALLWAMPKIILWLL